MRGSSKRDKLVEYVQTHGLGDRAAAAKACGFPNVHALDVCLSEARRRGLLPKRGRSTVSKRAPQKPTATATEPPSTSSQQLVIDGATLAELGRLVVDASNVIARLVHVASRLEGAPTLVEATSAFVSRLREAHITELPALLAAPVVVTAPSAAPRESRAKVAREAPPAPSPRPISSEQYAVEDKAGKVLSRHATIEDATKAVRTTRGGALVRRGDGVVMASRAGVGRPRLEEDEDEDDDDRNEDEGDAQ